MPDREYQTASYAGYDGQETISSSFLPRSITISCDALSADLRNDIVTAIDILSASGYLYIQSGDINRRIYCNQTVLPEVERILNGKICTFAVQFVCDSPFFEDIQDTSVPLYARSKELTTRFTLPCMFGETLAEADIKLQSRLSVEPVIRIMCPTDLDDATFVTLTNQTSGSKIELLYTPSACEEIVIDIKNRTINSSINGNIMKYLSDDTFLSDFILENPTNRITAMVGNINAGIIVECIYNNRYGEAVLV